MQLAVSDDSTSGLLYFGNSTDLYVYDGTEINLVLAKTDLGVWTISNNFLYYTAKFVNFSMHTGFDVKQRSLQNTSAASVRIGSVKGAPPQDIKIVDSTRTGMAN